MEELVLKVKRLIKKKRTFEEIQKELGLEEYELVGIIQMLKNSGELVDYVNGEIIKLDKPIEFDDVYQVQDKSNLIKLLLLSDTHLCNKGDRLDILRYLYKKCDEEGVKYVLHCGDFTDGRSNRPEQIYELKETSYEGQIDYCVKNYPRFNGKTFVIAGNHDGWWYKSAGSEIMKAICYQRPDIVYLGPDVADLTIGKTRIRMFHGYGGVAYAKSYKAQKYLEKIPADETPDILQLGHVHQAFYMLSDKTHVFQTGCLEDITPYCRSLGLSNEKSVWWVEIRTDSKGNPIEITPKLETFGGKVRKR